MRRTREIDVLADEPVVLEKPANFHAVAQVYRNRHGVSDGRALEILKRANR